MASSGSGEPSDALPGPSPAEVSDAIGQLHALEGAVLCAELEQIRAYDRSGAWRQDGFSTMAGWVCYALGVTTKTGADYVRVARALEHLAVLAAALAEGRLCFEQVRALVRVATPQSEAELVEQATGLVATQVERMVHALRQVPTAEADGANQRRFLRWRWRTEDRTLRLSGCLPDADGAVVLSAIEGIAERSLATPDDPEREPWDARCADALVELASCGVVAPGEIAGGGGEAGKGQSGGQGVETMKGDAGMTRAGAASAQAGAGTMQSPAGTTHNGVARTQAQVQSEAGSAHADAGRTHTDGGSAQDEVGGVQAGAGTMQSEAAGIPPEAGVVQGQTEAVGAHIVAGACESRARKSQRGAGSVRDEAGKRQSTPARAHGEAVRAEIVVHVQAEALVPGGEGAAALECGVPLAAETVRRLACDSVVQAVVENSGRPLGVGRRRRTVPGSLLRVLRHRDGGCRFPGCTRTRWVHAHHCHHWADGGPTDLGNLVLLCSAHHRFVHEGGWRIEGDPPGDLRFVHPDGRRLRVGPPGLRPEVAQRFGVGPWMPPWVDGGVSGRVGDPDLARDGPHVGSRSP